MFWRRTTPWAGFAGLVAGFLGAADIAVPHRAEYRVLLSGWWTPTAEINAQMLNFYGAIVAFVTDAVVTVIVTLVTKPKPIEQLAGLVWGCPGSGCG